MEWELKERTPEIQRKHTEFVGMCEKYASVVWLYQSVITAS